MKSQLFDNNLMTYYTYLHIFTNMLFYTFILL